MPLDSDLHGNVVESICAGRCALFVGPDLSESAKGFKGLPTSWQMAYELAKACAIDVHSGLPPLPIMAQYYERTKSRGELIDFLLKRIDDEHNEYKPLPVHELIARMMATLPFPVVVTGGWDLLLDQALVRQGVKVNTVCTSEQALLLDPNDTTPVLFKPYGSIKGDPDSLVITENDQSMMLYRPNLSAVITELKRIMGRYTLLLVGYTLAPDSLLVHLYSDIHPKTGDLKWPAVAVQSSQRAAESATWEARGFAATSQGDPVQVLRQLAEAAAREKKVSMDLPDDLAELSKARRLTPAEVEEQAHLIDTMWDLLGVKALVEQSEVPVLSEEQTRYAEEIRVAYERLKESFNSTPGPARVSLREANLEYAQQNYDKAEKLYRLALAAEPELAEAYHNLHYVQLFLDKWEDAMGSYLRAVELKPELAVLPERYLIEEVLGTTELGIVYKARDTQEGHTVAVKILYPSKAQNEQAVSAFQEESDILRQQNHPGIVRWLDFQEYKGNCFIVMEYLQGDSIAVLLAKRARPLPLSEAYRYTIQICESLEYLHKHHEHCIVHRNVNSTSIVIAGDRAVLINFEAARSLGGDRHISPAAARAPTPYQVQKGAVGQPLDLRTDVLGVATVFYEMLTKLDASQGGYRRLSEVRSDLSSALDIVVEKAIDPDSSARYPTVEAFRDDLRQFSLIQLPSEPIPPQEWLSTRFARVAQGFGGGGWLVSALWLLASIVVGFLIPVLLPVGEAQDTPRYAAAGMMTTFLVGGVTSRFFTPIAARRGRSAGIAAYGPITNLLLGVVCSLLFLNGLKLQAGLGCFQEYLIVLIGVLLLSLLIAIFASMFLLGVSNWLARIGLSYTSAFFGSYLVIIAILLVLGLFAALGPGIYIGGGLCGGG